MNTFFRDLAWLARPSPYFPAACQRLQTNPENVGSALRALASAALHENQLVRLAGVIKSLAKAGNRFEGLQPFRLGYVGNGTSDFVQAALIATAPRYGIALECVGTMYNQLIQDTQNPASSLYERPPDAVLVAIDWRGVPVRCSAGEDSSQAVSGVIGYLQTICKGIKANGTAACIVQNLAPPVERVLGSFDRSLKGSLRHTIDGVNAALAEMVRGSGDILLDIDGLAATVGLANWHSAA